MKKYFTLLLSSLFSLTLLAYDGNKLSVSVFDSKIDIRIEVDGRRFNMQGNSITLRDLNEGYHNVKIYRDKKRSGWGFGRRQDIIYNSSVYLRRGYHMDISVNRFGKVFTDERRIDQNDDWYDDDMDNGYDDGQNNDDNGGWNNGYGNVINAREFETVKESLRKEWFENNRLTSAKFIVDKNNFTTRQVKELMLLFSFENNRLELAKYAYRKTVDKQNYYQLNDALTFSSSKEELARFIRESR
ncbi:MAG TPA: DUF4476 domain-containing protein [Chitinophagaceae bacterium]|nr:DUF4476 domain-containing protein [Chitinophagaceae bacterium]